jgi:uncharacterized metal-binding protein YceD (DUF177 family)
MSGAPEFSRPIAIDTLGEAPRAIRVEADAAERAALAVRFALPSIDRLEADATLRRESAIIRAEGRLRALATQSCVATGEPVPARIDEPFALRFEPEDGPPSEEVELDEGDLDVIGYSGNAIDLGEVVAQTFALALDPFPRIADADLHLRAAGVLSEEEAEAAARADGPFAALKGLKP